MKQYYVNRVDPFTVRERLNIEVPYGIDCIGLFTESNLVGVGNFCGYYGAEFYKRTRLIGYYTAEARGVYRPEARISEVSKCDEYFEEVQIGSGLWDMFIDAENDEEAFEKFVRMEWRKR